MKKASILIVCFILSISFLYAENPTKDKTKASKTKDKQSKVYLIKSKKSNAGCKLIPAKSVSVSEKEKNRK